MLSDLTIKRKRPDKDVNSQILHIHDSVFVRQLHFNPSFMEDVSKYLSNFTEKFIEGVDGCLVAQYNNNIIGSIVIDSHTSLPDTARLRLFAVEQQYQRKTLGKQLLTLAINSCKTNNFRHIYLWTFNLLTAANHLYRSKGFTVTQVRNVNYWGEELEEKKYELYLR